MCDAMQMHEFGYIPVYEKVISVRCNTCNATAKYTKNLFNEINMREDKRIMCMRSRCLGEMSAYYGGVPQT